MRGKYSALSILAKGNHQPFSQPTNQACKIIIEPFKRSKGRRMVCSKITGYCNDQHHCF